MKYQSFCKECLVLLFCTSLSFFCLTVESVMWNEYGRLPSPLHALSSDIQKLLSIFPDLHGDSLNSMPPSAATPRWLLSDTRFSCLCFQTSLKRRAGLAYLMCILVCGCQKFAVRDRAIYSDNGDVYSMNYIIIIISFVFWCIPISFQVPTRDLKSEMT